MAQLYTTSSSSSWILDKGALMPAMDPDSDLILSPSWRTSKGTPGIPDVYLSVVFPSLLLPLPLPLLLLSLEPLKLLGSIYSSIAVSTLSLDEERTILNSFMESLKKLKMKIGKYLDLERGKSYGRRRLLDEDLRWEWTRKEISEIRMVTQEINYL